MQECQRIYLRGCTGYDVDRVWIESYLNVVYVSEKDDCESTTSCCKYMITLSLRDYRNKGWYLALALSWSIEPWL